MKQLHPVTMSHYEKMRRIWIGDYYWHDCGAKFSSVVECFVHLQIGRCTNDLPKYGILLEKPPKTES